MKTKKVNRYYCDFCKKSGCSKWHIQRHEERCTMNPDRVCGMCKADGDVEQVPMKELLEILPDPALFWKDDEWGKTFHCDVILDEKIKELQTKTQNCPACTLAALRQKRIPVAATSFSFTEECKSWWVDFNMAHSERY